MGAWIKSDSIEFGRNVETPKYSDKKYVRCSRCGFICNTDRDNASSVGSRIGWGLSYQDYDIGTAYNDSKTNYNGNDTATLKYNNEQAYNVPLSYVGGDTTLTYDGIIRTITDPVQVGGCPQCGTYLYDK